MKRKARKNPLVTDPSMLDATDIQLEVARLVAEYKGDPSGEIETYTDFELQTTRGGLYSFWFTSDLGYWYYWDETYLKWRRWSIVWPSIWQGEHRFVYVPHSNRPDTFFFLQRTEDTLRIYELRVVG